MREDSCIRRTDTDNHDLLALPGRGLELGGLSAGSGVGLELSVVLDEGEGSCEITKVSKRSRRSLSAPLTLGNGVSDSESGCHSATFGEERHGQYSAPRAHYDIQKLPPHV